MSIGEKVNICRYTLAALTGILCLYFFRQVKEETVLVADRQLRSFFARQSGRPFMEKLQDFLRSRGAVFSLRFFGRPYPFIFLSITTSCLTFILLVSIDIWLAFLSSLLIMFFPTLLLELQNNSDNIRFLSDMKLIYNALFIRIKAGVYCMDALCECETLVKSRRIKAALRELSKNMVIKNDIYDSLENFKKSFNCVQIDGLIITLVQSLHSGKSLELLEDLSGQLKDMETVLAEKRKSSLERKMTFLQLGVLASVLGMVLSSVLIFMLNESNLF